MVFCRKDPGKNEIDAIGSFGMADSRGEKGPADSGEVARRRRGRSGQRASAGHGAPDGGVTREDWWPEDARR